MSTGIVASSSSGTDLAVTGTPQGGRAGGTGHRPGSRAGRRWRDLVAAFRRDRGAIGSLLAFTVAAVTLLAVARSGADTVVVQGVLLGFVAVGTLWIRAQYVDGLDGRQWVVPGNPALVLAVGGVVSGVCWSVVRADGWLLGSLYAFWLGSSALVTRLRDRHSHGQDGVLHGLFERTDRARGRLGAGVTGVGLLLTSAGTLALGRVEGSALTAAGLALGLGLLVVLPLGAGLLAEAAVDRVQQGARHWSAVLVSAGTAAFVAVAGTCWLLAGNVLVLLAFGVLAVVVVGLVSSTHADVVVLMAVVALLGVTPHQVTRPGVTGASAPAGAAPLPALVALGDSYLSGEGAPEYYEGTDDAGSNQCRRAPTAWPVLAADDLFGAMAFLACSGARAGNIDYPITDAIPSDPAARAYARALDARGLLRPQAGGDDVSQLVRWRQVAAERNLAPALVVLSIGGNDAGFSTIGQMCLAPGSCADRPDLWVPSLPQVRDQLRLVYAEVSETFPTTPVVVVGYPDPVDVSPAASRCPQVTLTAAERRFVHEFLTGIPARAGAPARPGLNDVIEQAAAEAGFWYVPQMQDALRARNLQLCDPDNDDRPGLSFVGLRSVRGAAEQRFNPANWLHSSLHPNARGHAAMARAFLGWYAAATARGPLKARVPSSAPAVRDYLPAPARARWDASSDAAAQGSVDASPQCDLFASGRTGCRTLGTQWSLEQVRHVLLVPVLPAVLVAGLAIWSAAVGFFGWRRRAWCRRHAAGCGGGH